MAFFNAAVGLLVGGLCVLPFFAVKKKWAKTMMLVGIIGGTVIGTELSDTYLYPQYLGWEFEQDIKQQPLFALVEKYHPAEFNAYIKKIKSSIRKKDNVNTISAYSAELLNQIFYQHLEHASAESILLYLTATIDFYRYVYTLDPRAVLKLENGDSQIAVNIETLASDKNFQVLLNHVLETKKLVIESSIDAPVTPVSQDTSLPLLNKVIDELVSKYGPEVVRQVFSSTSIEIPAKIASMVIIEFYSNVATQGKENAANIMRYIAEAKLGKVEKNKPEEQKPVEQKLVEQKPEEQKPEEKKPEQKPLPLP